MACHSPRPNCAPAPLTFQLSTLSVFSILWKPTTFLKNSNWASPRASFGKYVTGVDLGHEMMDTRAMPAMIAPFTLLFS